jgi:hypothetical protein
VHGETSSRNVARRTAPMRRLPGRAQLSTWQVQYPNRQANWSVRGRRRETTVLCVQFGLGDRRMPHAGGKIAV